MQSEWTVWCKHRLHLMRQYLKCIALGGEKKDTRKEDRPFGNLVVSKKEGKKKRKSVESCKTKRTTKFGELLTPPP